MFKIGQKVVLNKKYFDYKDMDPEIQKWITDFSGTIIGITEGVGFGPLIEVISHEDSKEEILCVYLEVSQDV